MHDAGDRRALTLAERIIALPRAPLQFARIGQELAGDRIVTVAALDRAHELRGDGEGIATHHGLERGRGVGVGEARPQEVVNRAQRSGAVHVVAIGLVAFGAAPARRMIGHLGSPCGRATQARSL